MHARHFAASLATVLAAVLAPVAAHAQAVGTDVPVPPTDNAPQQSVFSGDYLTIGVGGIYSPSYEGSDNYTISATPLLLGQYKGITVSPRPGGIGLDFIPDPKGAKIGFILGPVVNYSRNRAHNIKDPVVLAAGRLKSAVDVGVTGGATAYRLLDPYDSLTLSADFKWNVNSASKGMTIDPSLTYLTPVSKAAIVSLGVSAKHVDGNYARYYYDVTPAQSLASGLPLYSARGGWASVGANILAAYDLDGNLLNGGFSLLLLGSYTKLLNDAKYTPYTSIRGSANQWVGGAGVAYTF